VGNNEYEVTGIHLGGRQRLDGGKLAAYLAPRMKTRELPGLLVRALVGRPGSREGFQVFSAAEIWIDTLDNRRVSVATDGEVAVMATPLHYQIAPGALKVFAPTHRSS
jgi:diacylglycerol kinase family enzyme